MHAPRIVFHKCGGMGVLYHFDCERCHRSGSSNQGDLRICRRCLASATEQGLVCRRCGGRGTVGLFAPGGWWAGEVLWTFLEFLIVHVCPKCAGSGRIPLPPKPPPPPAPPARSSAIVTWPIPASKPGPQLCNNCHRLRDDVYHGWCQTCSFTAYASGENWRQVPSLRADARN